MKKKITCIALCSLVLLFSQNARALLFDAPEFLEEKAFSTGTVAEVFLNDPVGEGLEFRLKYGLSSTFNSQLIIGTGSESRGFRLGVQTSYSIFPDLDGQIGLGLNSTVLHLEREEGSALSISVGPMLHKRLDILPFLGNFYMAAPAFLEFNHGSYAMGLQLVLGAISDTDNWFFTTELGVGLGEEQSYLALGGGFNFSSKSSSHTGSPSSTTKSEEFIREW